MPTHYAVICLKLHNPNSDPDPDLRPIELKIGTVVTSALGNVHIKLGASAGQTDRQDP